MTCFPFKMNMTTVYTSFISTKNKEFQVDFCTLKLINRVISRRNTLTLMLKIKT